MTRYKPSFVAGFTAIILLLLIIAIISAAAGFGWQCGVMLAQYGQC